MDFLIYSKRIRIYYFIIIVLGILVLLIYSWNGITSPNLLNVELESNILPIWDDSPQFNSTKIDFSRKLFDLNFQYILSSNPCPSEDALAVIIVTSHYNNVETRSAMRRAFTENDLKKLGLQRVFLLGQAPDSVYMTQASILHESKRFGDIIQGTFKEAYRNLTYKHVMGLKWASENCPSAKYIIKMDDDIVINLNKIVKLLYTISLPRNSIAGYILRDMKPIREPANKWYVTQEEYRWSKYPSFVSGWFYITPIHVVTKLVLLSHYYKYFWIDDVFVTGILAKNLNIRQYDLREYFTVYPEFLQCCITDVKKNIDCDVLVGPNGGDNNLFYEFNEALKVCQARNCDKRVKPINETCVAERKINLKGGNGFVENYKLH